MTITNKPRHIAIIMDGNGRWAKQRHLPRVAGHKAGVDSVREVIKGCMQHGIEVLTLFAFSSENWRRPVQEVDYLMQLFLTALERESKKLHQQNIQLRVIGDRMLFSDKLRARIMQAETLTAANTGLKLVIAANYGGQWDITEATRKIARAVEQNQLCSETITSTLIEENLATADLPEPDLLIRTSGEHRISNFMLWQLAYAEFYFTETFWPDFHLAELEKALTYYASKERRFGYISEQIKRDNCA